MTFVQHFSYAKTKSYATSRREDPEFVPPTSLHARPDVARIGKVTVSSLDKRQRTEDLEEDQPQAKRDKSQDDSDDGEEMEIEDDDEKEQQNQGSGMSSAWIYFVGELFYDLSTKLLPPAQYSAQLRPCCARTYHKKLPTMFFRFCSSSMWYAVYVAKSVTPLQIDIAVSNQRTSRKHRLQMRQVQRSKWHKYYLNHRSWLLLQRKL